MPEAQTEQSHRVYTLRNVFHGAGKWKLMVLEEENVSAVD